MGNLLIKQSDKRILTHLTPYTDIADTYFCSIWYKNKDAYMDSVFEKVSSWVVQNGGTIKRMSGKQIIGVRKGYIVRILFPCYSLRDMKNVMATVYDTCKC